MVCQHKQALNQASKLWKSSLWLSSRNLLNVLIGLMALRVMAASLAHSRFGPKTTARLVLVILLMSLLAETYVGGRKKILHFRDKYILTLSSLVPHNLPLEASSL